MLDDLERAYLSGVLSVGHGDKRVSYRSKPDMQAAIYNLKRRLGQTTRDNVSLAKCVN